MARAVVLLSLLLLASCLRADPDSDARAALAIAIALQKQPDPFPKQDLPNMAEYRWEPFADGDVTQCKLMRRTEQVGVYVYAEHAYYPIIDRATRRFGSATAPPIHPPEQPLHRHPASVETAPVAIRFAPTYTAPVYCGPRG